MLSRDDDDGKNDNAAAQGTWSGKERGGGRHLAFKE